MSVAPKIVAGSGSAAGALIWRYRQRYRLTFVVKATFVLVPDGTMALTDPAPICDGDQHHKNNPMRSIRAASDLVPYRPKVDVILVGHAFAPPPDPACRVVSRLAIYAPESGGLRGAPLIDKALLASASHPFMKMPLLYERAYGGVGFADNPFGVGASGGDEAPSLLDPRDPKRVAGFGPIDGYWPARKRRMGSMKREDFKKPILDVADDLDWSYFQASPIDQRLDAWRGGEGVELSGLNPRYAILRTRFPAARGLVRVFARRGADPVPVVLAADLVHFDTDHQICSVTWRGNIEIPSPEIAAAYRVAALVEVGSPADESAWPDPFADEARAARIATAVDRKMGDPNAPETMTLADDDLLPIDEGEPTVDAGRLRPEPIERTVVLGDEPEAPPRPGVGTTIPIPAPRPAAGTTLPIPAPSPGTTIPIPAPKRDPLAQTVTAFHVVAAAPVLPFREGAPDEEYLRAQAPVPAPKKASQTLPSSLDDPDDAPPPTLPFEPRTLAPKPGVQPAPPAEPVPADPPVLRVEAPAPAPSPQAAAAPTRVFAPEPAPPPAPAQPPKPAARKKESPVRPPPPPGPSAAVKQGLYGRFGK